MCFLHFLSKTSGYIYHSVGQSVGPSIRPSVGKSKMFKKSNSNFSALVLDRDLGVSREHQSDDKDEDEDDDEEVKDSKKDNEEAEEDDKEEDNDNYQTI